VLLSNETATVYRVYSCMKNSTIFPILHPSFSFSLFPFFFLGDPLPHLCHCLSFVCLTEYRNYQFFLLISFLVILLSSYTCIYNSISIYFLLWLLLFLLSFIILLPPPPLPPCINYESIMETSLLSLFKHVQITDVLGKLK
jgi:hypothetical protein